MRVGKSRYDDRDAKVVTHQDMFSIQRRLGASDNKLKEINSCVATIVGQKRMQPYLAQALVDRNRQLSDFFTLNTDCLWSKTKDKVKSKVKRPAVVSDIGPLVTFVMEYRGLDPLTAEVRMGFDLGGGWLKLMVLVTPQVDGVVEVKKKRARFADGLQGRDHKLTSGKRCLMVAGVPNVDEDTDNVNQLLDIAEVEDLGDSPWAEDIKMQLAVVGKQGPSCKRNCPLCECFAPYTCPCPLNTLGSLEVHRINLAAALEAGGNIKTEAMKHNNCVRRHRLHGSPDTKVISILYFPELHVLTGVISKLLTAMMESYPQHEAEAGKEWLSKWMKKHNIQWRVDRPGTMIGYYARKIVEHGDKLREDARKAVDLPYISAIKTLYYGKVIVKFNAVVVACFGQELHDNYRFTIAEFESYYRRLDTTVTTKAHMVFRHITEFLEEKGEVAGLGAYSEQAFEEFHHECNEEFTGSGEDKENYAEECLRDVVRLCSKNL